MRRFSSFLFWLGLMLVSLVVTLTINDTGISEIIVGLMFAAERDFLAAVCLLGIVLMGISFVIRRRQDLKSPKWRLGVLGLGLIISVVVSYAALKPGFSTTNVSYDSQGVYASRLVIHG